MSFVWIIGAAGLYYGVTKLTQLHNDHNKRLAQRDRGNIKGDDWFTRNSASDFRIWDPIGSDVMTLNTENPEETGIILGEYDVRTGFRGPDWDGYLQSEDPNIHNPIEDNKFHPGLQPEWFNTI